MDATYYHIVDRTIFLDYIIMCLIQSEIFWAPPDRGKWPCMSSWHTSTSLQICPQFISWLLESEWHPCCPWAWFDKSLTSRSQYQSPQFLIGVETCWNKVINKILAEWLGPWQTRKLSAFGFQSLMRKYPLDTGLSNNLSCFLIDWWPLFSTRVSWKLQRLTSTSFGTMPFELGNLMPNRPCEKGYLWGSTGTRPSWSRRVVSRSCYASGWTFRFFDQNRSGTPGFSFGPAMFRSSTRLGPFIRSSGGWFGHSIPFTKGFIHGGDQETGH